MFLKKSKPIFFFLSKTAIPPTVSKTSNFLASLPTYQVWNDHLFSWWETIFGISSWPHGWYLCLCLSISVSLYLYPSPIGVYMCVCNVCSHLFSVLITSLSSYWRVKVFPYFLLWNAKPIPSFNNFFILWLLTRKCPLYILIVKSLADVHAGWIPIPLCGFPFHFVMVYFDEVLHFDEMQIIAFKVIFHGLSILSR